MSNKKKQPMWSLIGLASHMKKFGDSNSSHSKRGATYRNQSRPQYPDGTWSLAWCWFYHYTSWSSNTYKPSLYRKTECDHHGKAVEHLGLEREEFHHGWWQLPDRIRAGIDNGIPTLVTRFTKAEVATLPIAPTHVVLALWREFWWKKLTFLGSMSFSLSF